MVCGDLVDRILDRNFCKLKSGFQSLLKCRNFVEIPTPLLPLANSDMMSTATGNPMGGDLAPSLGRTEKQFPGPSFQMTFLRNKFSL